MTKQKWIVLIDDNFSFMDEHARYKDGEYDSYEEAIARCKSIVDDFLLSDLKYNDTAETLYSSYTMFGEDPFIIGNKTYEFSSWDYAKERCETLPNTSVTPRSYLYDRNS